MILRRAADVPGTDCSAAVGDKGGNAAPGRVPFIVVGVESAPLVDVVPGVCRAVPGDCSGYRVPLPEVDFAVGCGRW